MANAACEIYRAPAVFFHCVQNFSKIIADKSIVTPAVCIFAHCDTSAVILATVSAQLIRILHCSGDLQGHYVGTATVELSHG